MVISRVEAAGLLDSLGGRERFRHDYLDLDAAENAVHYARQLRRALISGRRGSWPSDSPNGATGDEEPETLAAWLRVEIDAIESRANEDDHVSRIGDEGLAMLRDIDEARASDTTPGLPTGIDHIDEVYGGLAPGRLYVIAARPGVGKSSLSQQIGEHIAAMNTGTLFVSLEMTRRELAERYFARRTKINNKYLGNRTISDDERSTLAKAVDDAQQVPFWIAEPFGRRATVEAICADARVRCAVSSVRLLIVDYRQIIEKSNPRHEDYQVVTAATRAFKQLSRELSIPVVLLSQLSRKGDEGKTIDARG